tara:strand:- start:4204 stop:5274 length:1071 start_codon:yes stop_codon:yes gene_type:complete
MQFLALYFPILLLCFSRFYLTTFQTAFLIASYAFFLSYIRTFGADYWDYVTTFESYTMAYSFFMDGSLEPFWLLLVKFNELFLFDFHVGYGITAFLSVYIRVLAICIFFKFSKNLAFIGILVFIANDFIIRDLGQIRNGLASSFFILFLSLYYNQSSSLKKFLTASFGIFSHYASFFGIAIFYLAAKIRGIYFFIISLLYGVSLFSFLYFSQQISEFIRPYSLILSLIIDKLYQYTSSEIYIDDTASPIFIYIAILVSSLIFFVRKKLSDFEFILYKVYLFAPLTFFVLYSYPVLSNRLSTFILSLNCLMIPIALKYVSFNFNSESRTLIFVSTTIFFMFIGTFYMDRYLKIFFPY